MPDQDVWGFMRIPNWLWLLLNHRRIIAGLWRDNEEMKRQLGYESYATIEVKKQPPFVLED